jgi:ribosome maturation factor RimP
VRGDVDARRWHAMNEEIQVLHALAAPLAAERGLDLVDVEIKGTGGKRLVRVVVDRKGCVELADCSEVSKRLSEVLDTEDPIEGRYSLEVTSPGVDRPLDSAAAFDRVEGRLVEVHVTASDGRTSQIRGTVRAAQTQEVVLEVDGEEVRVAYSEIAKAKQALPW